jgi:hypothetical protein
MKTEPLKESSKLKALALLPAASRYILGALVLTGWTAMADSTSQPSLSTETSSGSGVSPEKTRRRLEADVDRTVDENTVGMFFTYSSKTDDTSKYAIDLLATYKFGKNEEWALKFGLPYEFIEPGNDHGISDLRILLNRSFKVSEKFRWSAAVGARLNTAADLSLGTGSDDIILEANSSYRANEYLQVKLGVGYERALYTEPGGKDTNRPYIGAGMHGLLSSDMLWNASYDLKHNIGDDETEHILIFGLRYLLGEQKLWTVSTVFRVPIITETNLRYEVGAGISRYF